MEAMLQALSSGGTGQPQNKTQLQLFKRSCWSCSGNSRSGNLLTCGKCRRVVYCSSECQKKDWTAGHKAFCSKWVKASATFGPSPALVPQYPPRSSQLTAIVNNLNALVSKNMGIFGMDFIAMNCTMHQPRCMCCYGVESAERKLVKCPVCLLFAWCADGDCEDKCRQQHVEEGLCDVIKETVTDEEVVSKHIRRETVTQWIPARSRSTPSPLPASWNDFLSPLNPPHPLNHSLTRAMVTTSLSIPLTIVMALERFGLASSFASPAVKKKLTVHVVGAAPEYELDVAPRTVEEILHLLPGVKELDLVYVGPDMEGNEQGKREMQVCAVCRNAKCSRTLTVVGSLYHDFLCTCPPTPDLIIAFNSGIHSQLPPTSWIPTISAILARKIPTCFTSYSLEEARKDMTTLKAVVESCRLKLDVVWSEETNPWQDCRKTFDLWTEERYFAGNSFTMGFKGV